MDRAEVGILNPRPFPNWTYRRVSKVAATLNATFFPAGIWIASPVLGFRPVRAAVAFTLNVPKSGKLTVPLCQRLYHRLQQGVHHTVTLRSGQPRLCRHLLDQLHFSPFSPFRTSVRRGDLRGI